jgi:lipopolysaccharide export LptBFGC system permease protein LptF
VIDGDDLVLARSRPTQRPVERRELETRPEDFVNGAIRDLSFLTTWELKRHIDRRRYLPEKDTARERLHFHQRLAMPWTCLIVVLFGIPAGATTARSGALAGIVLALTFLFGFYALMQVGTFVSIRGLIPAWAGAWLPNAIFLAVGALMLARLK